MRSYGGLQDREWSGCELMLFELRDLKLAGQVSSELEEEE